MAQQGHIFQISVSDSGLPKYARHSAEIDGAGLTEDRRGSPKKHDGDEHAVCLYSLEKILVFQTEGHPIFPGSSGENITLAGIDWDKLEIGTQMKLGDEVILEITKYVKPCVTIASSFNDGGFARMLQEKNPGWSRLYARVLKQGTVTIGDKVEVIG